MEQVLFLEGCPVVLTLAGCSHVFKSMHLCTCAHTNANIPNP